MVGTIIGVLFIVIALEGTRRLAREYERSIKRVYFASQQQSSAALAKNNSAEVSPIPPFR